MYVTPDNLTGLPPIWTAEWGILWENLFNYCLFLGFMGGHVRDGITTFFTFLKSLVNKIQFTVPKLGLRIDFSKYAWDDEFFDHLEKLVLMKVDAKEQKAKAIKLKYQPLIEAAEDQEAKDKVLEEYADELEKLSDATIDDIKAFNPQLFKATITRFGEDKAEEYLRNHVKASVVKRKNGSAERVSMTATLKQINSSTPKEAANA